MKAETRYVVMQLVDGLLSVVKGHWGGNYFLGYGYETQEDALYAIKDAGDQGDYFSNLVIIPMINWVAKD